MTHTLKTKIGPRVRRNARASQPVSNGEERTCPPAPASKPSAPLKLVLQADRAPKDMIVERAGEETAEETTARMVLTPAVTDSAVLRMFSQPSAVSTIDATLTASVMAERIAAVNAGDLSGLVAMLTSKAIAMDAVANEYLRRASLNMREHLDATETYTRMALKAQAQSRANIEAISEIKNPRPVFARQTNIAAGPQQVNNSLGPQQVNNETAPREEKPLLSNKLLED